MENVKFIKEITSYVKGNRTIIGNCVYYNLNNGNKVKLWCYNYGVEAYVINKFRGTVDTVVLPFSSYFKPVKCNEKNPEWVQHIANGEWLFEKEYPHTLPTETDYKNLAAAIESYIEMYE